MTDLNNNIKSKQYGIFRQIMTLIILGVVISAILVFSSIHFLLNLQEKQLNQTIELLNKEMQLEEEIITASQDEKINVIVSMLTQIATDLIWAYDLTSLNLYANSIVKDADIDSVVFLGPTGTFLAGEKQNIGTKVIRQDIIVGDEKLGSIVIGVNTDHLDQNLMNLNKRIAGFEQIAGENIRESNRTLKIFIVIMVGMLISGIYIFSLIIKNIIGPIKHLSLWTRQVAAGDLSDFEISARKNEIGELNTNFSHMVNTLRESASERTVNVWINTGQSLLDEQMRGNLTIQSLSLRVLTFVANYFDAPVGAMYINNGEDGFTFIAGHGFTPTGEAPKEFAFGDGYIGQAALDRKLIIIEQVPAGYLPISSALGNSSPANVLVQPIIYNKQVVGVMELGSFNEFTEAQKTFLKLTAKPIAVAMNAFRSRGELQTALDNAQHLNEEAKAQQEKLQAANENYEKQSLQLQTSEEELKAQQEELQATNEELLEKTRLLEDELKSNLLEDKLKADENK